MNFDTAMMGAGRGSSPANMKITAKEHDGCFSFDISAETLAEAALLVRFGMNRTKLRTSDSNARADGTFDASLVFGKSRRADSDVPKRR